MLAIEIAREGREGRKIGTMFIVSDSQHTLEQSRCLILDPLWNHPDGEIIGEILPEIWLLQHYSLHLNTGEYSTRHHEQMAIVSKQEDSKE